MLKIVTPIAKKSMPEIPTSWATGHRRSINQPSLPETRSASLWSRLTVGAADTLVFMTALVGGRVTVRLSEREGFYVRKSIYWGQNLLKTRFDHLI